MNEVLKKACLEPSAEDSVQQQEDESGSRSERPVSDVSDEFDDESCDEFNDETAKNTLTTLW